MTEFLSKLLDRQTLVLLILGTACTLVFVFQGIPLTNVSIVSAGTRLIALGLGVILLTLGIFSFFGFFGMRPSTLALKHKYGIKITSHAHNVSASSPIELRGNYKMKPKRDLIYALERNDQTNQFYIKNRLNFLANKTWYTQVRIGNGDNKPRTLFIAYFGEDTKILMDYFVKVRDEAKHVGIKAFPSDFHILDEVTIILLQP